MNYRPRRHVTRQRSALLVRAVELFSKERVEGTQKTWCRGLGEEWISLS